MVDEAEVHNPADEVRTGQAPVTSSPDSSDPLRSLRVVKWLTRLFVYPGVTALIPLDHALSGLTWQQAISVHLGGYVIATIAIEFAFAQVFKLRKRSAYPGIVLTELGRGQRVDAAAQHALGVIQRLLGVRVSFLALRSGDDGLDLVAVSGIDREDGERLLQAWMPEARETLRSQQPLSVKSARNTPAETGVDRDERLAFTPVVALQQPIGVLAIAGRRGSGNLKDGQLLSSIGVALGLSLENLRQQEELRGSEAKFRTLTETVAAAAFIIQGTRFCYVNSTTEELTGYSREELLAMDFWDVMHPGFQELVKQRGLARQRGEDVPRRYEAKLLTKSGEERWADLTLGVIEFEGKPAVLGTGFDITERKRAEEERERLHAELEVKAITDSLTGLYNHAHFYQRLAEEVDRSKRYNHGFAVMMMDVDDFKRFNDSRGHQAGDEALRLVADCIRSGLRRSDLAFRYGGDEFAAILPHGDSPKARAVVSRINGRITRRLKKTDDGAAAQLSLSVGIACFPDDGTAADDLVRIADAALYSAKWVARARDIMGQKEDIQSLVSTLVDRRAGAEVPTGQAPLRPEALHEQRARIVSSVASSIAVALKDAGVAQALEDLDMQILATVGAAAEIKDRYIRGHPERVSEGAAALAEEIGLSPKRVKGIRIAGILHDIGKITISEGILNKPGKLTRAEFATIKEHPIVGATLVSQVRGFEQLIPAIRHHHERLDGAGYPDGLAGEEIPLEARILSVVDVFDALTHERSYRNALSREEAIGELERGPGTQFDPAVLKAFLALVERGGEEPAAPAQAASEDRPLAAAVAEGQKLKGTGER
jgi:diguanylate cyclase (GGDEF)-like protein/PAS domain S-box-containing protein/putative nucleotidyltransferase with HDIG domain